MTTWHASPYGSFRFCDSITFSRVVKQWKFYADKETESESFQRQQQKLKDQWETAAKRKKERTGFGTVLTGFRSAAPRTLEFMKDPGRSHKVFWKNGTTFPNQEAKMLNPMFSGPYGQLNLHYGTDPLLGFHLATAYQKLAKVSPSDATRMDYGFANGGKLDSITKAAYCQFASWRDAFRRVFPRVTLWICNSDALAFCHQLQHICHKGYESDAGWHRRNWSYDPLKLDSEDYRAFAFTGNRAAATSFDMIDTSNLIDHLGSLNLLIATAPLLSDRPNSVIHTEMLIAMGEKGATAAETLLPGDLSTMSLLLGLQPSQYWTSVVSNCNYDELLGILGTSSMSPPTSRHIIHWKSVDVTQFDLDEDDLVDFLRNIYVKMFPIIDSVPQHGTTPLPDPPNDVYTQASFATFILNVMNSKLTKWTYASNLIYLMLSNSASIQNLAAMQLYFHHFRLGTVTQLTSEWYAPSLRTSSLREWKKVSYALCITMVAPRNCLSPLEHDPAK